MTRNPRGHRSNMIPASPSGRTRPSARPLLINPTTPRQMRPPSGLVGLALVPPRPQRAIAGRCAGAAAPVRRAHPRCLRASATPSHGPASRPASSATPGSPSLPSRSAERLQDERDVSGLFDVGATGQGAVADARNATDQALATLNEQMGELPDDVNPAVAEARRSTEVQLGLLDAYRGSRDIVLEPYDEPGVDDYNLMVESLFRFVKASGTGSTDAELVVEIDALDSLARATESASVERALLAHVLASGDPLTDTERQREAVSQGEQDYLLARFTSTAEPEVRAHYYSRSAGHARRRQEHPRWGSRHRRGARHHARAWYEAATSRIDVMRDIQTRLARRRRAGVQHGNTGTDRGRRHGGWRSSLFSPRRSHWRPRSPARSSARCAGCAERLSRPPTSTCPHWCPGSRATDRRSSATSGTPSRPRAGRDRSGRERFQRGLTPPRCGSPASRPCCARTSTRSSSTCPAAPSRSSTVSSARSKSSRSRERDADQLGTLFRIDHLATRVRRHAESLLVLAGVEEMRRAGTAAPVLDVVRTAVGEVEQYPRVKFGVMPTDLVTPAAVDDVAHLLAELLDNATEFSAPSTRS